MGLEQEYSLYVTGDRLDFRTVIHNLGIPGRRLDPGDVNAYRCRSGLVITCDDEDAEIVSPPLPVRSGFAVEVATWAEHGRAELLRLLPPHVDVTPFSTHLSASMPDDLVDATCDLFARTFAPALMVLLGGADSHGIFVRPRPGRLEACGEHAMGGRLVAAVALVAGGARACAAALSGGDADGAFLPPLLAVDLRPARGRHGSFVGRHLAFGSDVLATGGHATLPLLAGGTMPVHEHLRQAWEAARAALGDAAGDAIVPRSGPFDPDDAADDPAPRPWSAPVAPSPFGDLLRRRTRPGLEVEPVAATWDFTAFRLTGRARHAFACVPGPQLAAFLGRLDGGALDDLLVGFVDANPSGRVLVAHEETAEAALWDDVVIGPDLLPYERMDADGDAVEPSLPVLSPAAYVRGGKAATLVPPALVPRTDQPIRTGPPPTGPSGSPDAPAPAAAPPTANPPPTPQSPPPERPRRRRRRVWIVVGSLLMLLVAGAAAAMTDVFSRGKPAGVEILTGPTFASSTTEVTAGPTTTGPTLPITTLAVGTTAVASTAPPTSAVTTTVTQPTTVVTVPTSTVTTLPVVTTVPVETTVPATTTTETVPPPTQLLAVVTSGILGCGFQPPSATTTQGSTVRFRNDTTGGITITVTPPAGASATISLEFGATSGPYALAAPGSYAVACTPGGDSIVGRMTLTVTAA